MKLIGVTGKSGAGKTSFSNFLGERKNVGVIYVDDIFNHVKATKLKRHVKGKNKNNQVKIFNTKTRYFINNHKLTFRISMAVKSYLIRREVQRQIADFKREGKDAVVVDSIHLRYLLDRKMFHTMVLVERNYQSRKKSLEERDEITKAEIIERDLPFKRKFSSVEWKDFDYIITNNLGKEELKAASQKVYDEAVGIKTFDERYKIPSEEPLTNLKNIVTTINKIDKINKGNRIATERK